jgi:hypothetical protein
MLRTMIVDHLISKSIAAINGHDPTILALVAREFFLQALDKGAPDDLLSRWLFTVNSRGEKLDKEQLRTMYFEAIANALSMTNADAHTAIKEAQEKYDSSSHG